MTVIETTAEVVLAHRSELGEGSLWSPSLGKLLWLDILKHEVHLFDPRNNADRTYPINDGGERFVSTVVESQSGGVVSRHLRLLLLLLFIKRLVCCCIIDYITNTMRIIKRW